MEWLSQISPDVAVMVITAIGSLFGYKKADDAFKAKLSEIKSDIYTAYQQVLADPTTWDRARELLETAAQKAADRLGLAKTGQLLPKVYQAVVSELINELLAKLQALLLQHKLQEQWNELFSQVAKIEGAFKSSTAPGEALTDGMQVEVVPRDQPLVPFEKWVVKRPSAPDDRWLVETAVSFTWTQDRSQASTYESLAAAAEAIARYNKTDPTSALMSERL